MATVIKTKEEIVLITDNELLGRYLNKNDVDAFEELVRRHSNLVMGVCQNMLFHTHDAEDAFQATFLILSRKASKLVCHGSIAGWLYQTAMRNCLQVRRRKGRARETEMIEDPIRSEEPWQTIAEAQERDRIYQEINRLPRRYREVIVLCHLEGRTRSEAAEFLDWTEAAVKAALARGRNLLRRRLIRRGLLASAALLMMRAATTHAQSAVSEPLIASALQHCQNVTPTVSVGTSSEFVRTLSHQGVLSMHSATLLKAVSLAASIAIIVAIPLAVLAAQTPIGEPESEIVATLVQDGSEQDDSGTSVKVSATTVTAEESDFNMDTVDAASTSFQDARRVDTSSAEYRFAIENSEEYWRLMLQSYEARAKAVMSKSKRSQLSETEKLTKLSEAYEYRAKVIEARLNLERIEFESQAKAKNAAEPVAESHSVQFDFEPKTIPSKESASVLATLAEINVETSQIAILHDEFSGIGPGCNLRIYRVNKFLANGVITHSDGGASMASFELNPDTKEIRVGDQVRLYPNPKLVSPSTQSSRDESTTESKSSSVPPASTDVVQPGEALLVESLMDPSLNRRVVVLSDYTIVLPLAGVVSVKNKTTAEISKILDESFSKFVANPSMFVARESASTPIKK